MERPGNASPVERPPASRYPRIGMRVFLIGIIPLITGILASLAFAAGPGNNASLIDNFNHTLNSNWRTSPGLANGISDTGTQASCGNSGTCSSYYTAFGNGSNGECSLTVAVLPGSGNVASCDLDSSQSGYYYCDYLQGTGWQINIADASGTVTQLASVPGDSLGTGDAMGLTVTSAGVLTCYRQIAATGSWNAEVSTTDTTLSGGYVGIRLRGTSVRVDDLMGGNDNLVSSTITNYSTVFTGQNTVTQPGAYTGQATVTVSGGGGGTQAIAGNCGGTTTDGGGATVPQIPCSVDVSSGGNAETLLGWGVGGIMFLIVVGIMNRTFGRKI